MKNWVTGPCNNVDPSLGGRYLHNSVVDYCWMAGFICPGVIRIWQICEIWKSIQAWYNWTCPMIASGWLNWDSASWRHWACWAIIRSCDEREWWKEKIKKIKKMKIHHHLSLRVLCISEVSSNFQVFDEHLHHSKSVI